MGSATKIVCQSENPGLGEFTAFADRSIRVKFKDRTLLRMKEGAACANIITNRGQELRPLVVKPVGFEKHVAAAL